MQDPTRYGGPTGLPWDYAGSAAVAVDGGLSV